MFTPISTYRIQLNPDFGFRKAGDIAGYLSDLGITHLYASPIFKPRQGSPHGYDVVDPNQLNPELGSREDFDELAGELEKRGLGWLQDIVPNHLAFHHENAMLWDVLENGPSSRFFGFFDIQWNHPYESIRDRLLSPFLGTFYGEALENGDIRLRYDANGLTVSYYDTVFPLKIESYGRFFTHDLTTLRRELGENHPDFIKLLGVLYVLKTLPVGEDASERYNQTRFVKRALWELYTQNPEIKAFIERNLETFNGIRGKPESFTLLDSLLAEQLFRLSFWKVAAEEINYRRFFNINEIISLRVEDAQVFDHVHSLVFDLVGKGRFSGLRIDHIDGLYDPTAYLFRMRERAPDSYFVVEKILDPGEELPTSWPVQGTTGYDFLNRVNGIFCEQANQRDFTRIYLNFADMKTPYDELLIEKKKLIITNLMAGDIDNLANLIKGISSRDRYGSDITIYGLKNALIEIMSRFPVYRTYCGANGARQTDRAFTETAVARAMRDNPSLLNEIAYIGRLLLLELKDYLSADEQEQCLHFVMRFQQFTAPLMAKGFEDTTLYVYNRLISLNEVGSSPETFGRSTNEFHEFNENRGRLWPYSLNATSTHDTKRGEDVRARINVLSEIPKEWEKNLKSWSRLNRKRKKRLDGVSVPDKNDEYFLYQTLLGAFPFNETEHPEFVKRIKAYVIKAVREAKVHTAWLKPDLAYEEAFLSFVSEILNPADRNPFLQDFLPFQKKVAHYGVFNSLSQVLLKIASPGIPDFYQGTELWDFSLVDPDNRRPVDFFRRRNLLEEIRKGIRSDIIALIQELLQAREDGRVKLFLTHQALQARKDNVEIFRSGKYIPLEVSGKHRENVVAFARNHVERWALTVVPRFLASLVKEGALPLGEETWSNTQLAIPAEAPRMWRNAITKQRVTGEGELNIGKVFEHFPVALLISEVN